MIEQNEADAALQLAVIAALRADPRVRATDVGVEVCSGIVSLTGEVASWDVRIAAQNAAHRVERVKDLANEIRVRAPGTPGAIEVDPLLAKTILSEVAVRAAVQNALAAFADREGKTIAVGTTDDGFVMLTGEVSCWDEKHAVDQAVRGMPGVRGVENHLQIRT